MSIEFLISTLFGVKATAILAFAAHQIIAMRAARQPRRVAVAVPRLPRQDYTAAEREQGRLGA